MKPSNRHSPTGKTGKNGSIAGFEGGFLFLKIIKI
jgi:hypothetical protein